MRKFEKISFKQFAKDVSEGDYNSILLPVRKTKRSAGYDFISFLDITIKSGEVVKIPTGIKISLEDDEFLGIDKNSDFSLRVRILQVHLPL